MSWQAKIEELYASNPLRDGYQCAPRFQRSASAERLARIESEFACRLPLTVRALLTETDGVMNRMAVDEGEWFDESWIVWPTEEIVERNRWARQNYIGRQLDQFLFFSSPGTDGILFGGRASRELQADTSVWAWYPDGTDDKTVAESLDQFLQRIILGGLMI